MTHLLKQVVQPQEDSNTRECNTCHQFLALDNFKRHSSRGIEYTYRRCRKCNAAVALATYYRNKEKLGSGKHLPLFDGTKKCSSCGLELAMSEFGFCFRNASGRKSCCKNCINDRQNQNRAATSVKKTAKRQALRVETFNAYGGCFCACCGERVLSFLTLDHVNDDGAQHRRKVNRAEIYSWLKRRGFPPGFRVLCFNCNCGRESNGGICPHVTQAINNENKIVSIPSCPDPLGIVPLRPQ